MIAPAPLPIDLSEHVGPVVFEIDPDATAADGLIEAMAAVLMSIVEGAESVEVGADTQNLKG